MARILYEILSGVVLNLIYMSMYSDGLKLTPVTYNPILREPFDLVCDSEVTITKTVAITAPDNIVAGSCTPALPPFPAGCSDTANYNTSWDEGAHTVTIKTSSLASNYNGTWKCTHNAITATYILVNREINDESFTLFPTSFTDNITSETTSISLSATYGCTDFEVFFRWFVVDSASNKIDIKGSNNAVENASVCTSLSGFSGYTEIKEVNEDVYSSIYVQGLDGSYRIGVEVHYMDEVTTLHSIKYFDTYFVFTPSTTPGSGGTNKPTYNNVIAFAILIVCLLLAYCIVVAVRFCTRFTENTSENCFLTFCQFIKSIFFDCYRSESSIRNWLLGFVYLVLYGLIVKVIVLPAVYYGYSKFQEILVIGVGFLIVLVLSGLCLLVVVWMLKKFVNNDASERSRSESCISLKSGTVMPDESGL